MSVDAGLPCPATGSAAGLPVAMWPGETPRPIDGLFVIGIVTAAGIHRELARRQLRLALRDALGALLGVAIERITIAGAPGVAPHIVIAGDAGQAARTIACSLSHDDALSLAAVHTHGPVGVDLMQVRDIPDWETVARDYLGPAACAALQNQLPCERAAAFARAWAGHEASLKCCGQPLEEWQPAHTQACRIWPLALPARWAGALAILQPNQE